MYVTHLHGSPLRERRCRASDLAREPLARRTATPRRRAIGIPPAAGHHALGQIPTTIEAPHATIRLNRTTPMRRVLIIETNSAVRAFLRDSFERSGFQAFESSDCLRPEAPSECALGCCCQSGARPDLVLAAVVVERLCSGVEVAAKALRLWPGTKVLIISATPPQFWPGEAATLLASLPADGYSFLAKPFTCPTL